MMYVYGISCRILVMSMVYGIGTHITYTYFFSTYTYFWSTYIVYGYIVQVYWYSYQYRFLKTIGFIPLINIFINILINNYFNFNNITIVLYVTDDHKTNTNRTNPQFA